LIIDVGPKPQDVVLSWKNLYAHNRKQIDPTAKRYFFVQDPVKLVVSNVPHEFTAQVPLQPDHPEVGVRRFDVKPVDGKAVFLISKDDADLIEGKKAVRFMDLFNFRAEKVEDGVVHAVFLGDSYEEARRLAAPLIQWVPFGSGVPCAVVLPDASVAEGVAEESCKRLKPDETVQFQRFGFVRVDANNGKLVAYFAHR
jgi:glutamyl-tRNA synthetase